MHIFNAIAQETNMYIDTHSRTSMEQSICDYFHVSEYELRDLFVKAGKSAQVDYYFDCVKFDKAVNRFISSHMQNSAIDQVLFYHLSRRLNSVQNFSLGSNLFDLLSSENAVTDFLKSHDVEFRPCKEHLDLIYKGKVVSLEDTERQNVPYLRWRLGHNKGHIDYCFNGFLLKDLIYRNNYARELYDVPEFIGILATFLERWDIGKNYFENSRYYCFVYCIPIDKIMFDGNDKLSDDTKSKYLLNQVLHRLYDYSVSDIRYMSDHDNLVIRLADSDTMQEGYFVSSEEINIEMLRY